jgi:hypothetical protein
MNEDEDCDVAPCWCTVCRGIPACKRTRTRHYQHYEISPDAPPELLIRRERQLQLQATHGTGAGAGGPQDGGTPMLPMRDRNVEGDERGGLEPGNDSDGDSTDCVDSSNDSPEYSSSEQGFASGSRGSADDGLRGSSSDDSDDADTDGESVTDIDGDDTDTDSDTDTDTDSDTDTGIPPLPPFFLAQCCWPPTEDYDASILGYLVLLMSVKRRRNLSALALSDIARLEHSSNAPWAKELPVSRQGIRKCVRCLSVSMTFLYSLLDEAALCSVFLTHTPLPCSRSLTAALFLTRSCHFLSHTSALPQSRTHMWNPEVTSAVKETEETPRHQQLLPNCRHLSFLSHFVLERIRRRRPLPQLR